MSEVPVRRIDWRFLLPSPAHGEPFGHALVVGGPPCVGEVMVSAGLARTVGGAGPADLVALLHDAGASAERPAAEALARLVPGGVAYGEGRRFGRMLERAGCRVVSIHAALPAFDACRGYLPLDHPHVLRWWLDTLFPVPTATRRALETALRLAAGDGRRLRRLVPAAAFVAVRDPADAQAPSVLAHPAMAAAVRDPAARVFAFVDAGNRAVLLPFAPSGREPIAVVKVPKLPAVNDRTEHEHAAMLSLRDVIPGELAAALPEPLALLRWGALTVSVEGYLGGRSMLRTSGAWGRPDRERVADLDAAARWLAEFHAAAPVERACWDAAAAERWVTGPAADYARRFGTAGDEAALFARLGAAAAALNGLPYPVVWHHRDYNVWNVLREGDRVRVIDWEGVRPGPPLVDLLHFATHWHETARHLRDDASQLRGFGELWLARPGEHRPAALSGAVHGAIQAYLDRVGLDPRFVPVLLTALWIELALRRAAQQEALGAAPAADPRAGNRNFPYVALLAAASDHLFPGHPG